MAVTRDAIPMNPAEVAAELIERADGNHRAAEVEAWKLRAAHGPDTAEGRMLAAAAFVIADLYFARNKKRDINDLSHYNVPLFNRGPNSVAEG